MLVTFNISNPKIEIVFVFVPKNELRKIEIFEKKNIAKTSENYVCQFEALSRVAKLTL